MFDRRHCDIGFHSCDFVEDLTAKNESLKVAVAMHQRAEKSLDDLCNKYKEVLELAFQTECNVEECHAGCADSSREWHEAARKLVHHFNQNGKCVRPGCHCT